MGFYRQAKKNAAYLIITDLDAILKLQFRKYPAIHINYRLSNYTISNKVKRFKSI